jgi:Tol biopolymer transport system component
MKVSLRWRSKVVLLSVLVGFSLVAPTAQAGRHLRTTRGVSGAQGLIAFTASEPDEGPITVGGSGSGEPDPARIYVVDPDGTHRRAVTGASLLKGSLAWSPDGSMLAFTTFDLDRMRERLSVMTSTGADRRVICTGCTGTFWVDTDGGICVDGGCPAAAPFADRLTWSPDGKWLAAPSMHDGGLVIVDVATGAPHVTSALGAVSGTSWSPDGSELAVSVDGEGLYVVRAPDGVPTLLHAGDPYMGSPPAWSRDGSTIAFGQAVRLRGDLRAKLLFVEVDDGSSRRILGPGMLFEIYDLEWSPSGDRLAVLHHPVHPPTAALLTVATDGSDVRMVALCENGRDDDGLCSSNGGGVAWSQAGRKLAFRNYDGRRSALTVLVTGGRALPISGALTLGCCFAWSPRPGT